MCSFPNHHQKWGPQASVLICPAWGPHGRRQLPSSLSEFFLPDGLTTFRCVWKYMKIWYLVSGNHFCNPVFRHISLANSCLQVLGDRPRRSDGNIPGWINPAVDSLWWFPQGVYQWLPEMATERVCPQFNSLGFIKSGVDTSSNHEPDESSWLSWTCARMLWKSTENQRISHPWPYGAVASDVRPGGTRAWDGQTPPRQGARRNSWLWRFSMRGTMRYPQIIQVSGCEWENQWFGAFGVPIF